MRQTDGPHWPVGGGEMGALVRAHDWATTPLGPLARWPPSLRVAADLALGCAFPMVVLWGPDLAQVYNDGYRAIMGDKHPAGLGQATRDCWPEVWHLNAPLYARARGGETVTLEDALYPIERHGRPEDAYFTLCYSPLRDAAGPIAGVLVTVFETTEAVRGRALEAERARLAAALREGAEQFRGFAENSADTLWIVDARTGALAYLSPAYERMWGEPRDAALRDLGRWGALVHPDDRARAARALAQVLAGAVHVGEYRIVRPADGAVRWVRDTGFPIRDAAGAVRRVAGIAQDITADKQAGAERERLLAAAEAAVRERDTFLLIAAHELRTPLTTLKGMTQLLLRRRSRGTLDPDWLAGALKALDHAADRLVTLTGDLLDVTRIRTGRLPLTLRPVDLAAVAGVAVAQARDRAGDGQRLTFYAPADLPPVLADEARIEQVLTNLLDNALKYSPGGGVVALSVLAEGAGVAVAVRDTGIGLPPGAGEAIFAPFGRAANATTGNLPGMGLGLYICRSIVERHGGWIRAASAGTDEGTTVTFWLPLGGPPDAG